MLKIIDFGVVTFRFKFNQRIYIRLINLKLMCLAKIQFFLTFRRGDFNRPDFQTLNR